MQKYVKKYICSCLFGFFQVPWHLPLHRIASSDAVVVMYSITDRSSFHSAREALEVLAASVDNIGDEAVHVPVLLLANKADLGHLRKVSDIGDLTVRCFLSAVAGLASRSTF